MRSFFLLRLSACEKQIMDILWSAGRNLSVSEVLELWDGDTKPSYNAVATHLTRLSHKNFVEHRKRSGEKTLYYSPVINRAKYHQRLAITIGVIMVACMVAAAGIIVALPLLRERHIDHQNDVPKPAPAVEQTVVKPDTIEAMPKEKDIVLQPSLSAEYPGGEEAVQDFFEQHWLHENEGRVYLHLLIDKEGRVREAKAELDPSTTPELAKELEKTAMKMPRWKPATEHGVAVSSRVTVAVVLLNDE